MLPLMTSLILYTCSGSASLVLFIYNSPGAINVVHESELCCFGVPLRISCLFLLYFNPLDVTEMSKEFSV